MISVWRLDKEHHMDDTKSGKGARLYGGRWNQRGLPVIYTSDSLALATLEKFVHISRFDVKIKFKSIEIKIPKSVAIQTVRSNELKSIHNKFNTQEYGSKWLRENKTAVLKVPSAIIQPEFNYLLNPNHPDFKKIKFSEFSDFRFDTRLWK